MGSEMHYPISMRMLSPKGNPDTLLCVLSFYGTDPLAVHLAFPEEDGVENLWLLSRELLKEGCSAHVGEGDVQCWPGRELLFMALSSPSGQAVMICGLKQVREFLRATEYVVPIGSEILNIDDELERLLKNS